MHPKRRFTSWFVTLALALLLLSVGGAAAQDGPAPQGVGAQAAPGTAFTYQGQLKSNGSPVNGACDFEFRLFDAAAAGAQVGATQTKNAVAVANGLFTVSLDFGASAFTGDARFLDITVRCPAGSGAFTPLSPRQALTPAPYALALPGLYTRQNATSPNVIGGYSGNVISPTVEGGVIAGGGVSGAPNTVTSNYGTVSGGSKNQAGLDATVAGGYGNTASGEGATVGGGLNNKASGDGATVGGGENNNASGEATVGGGDSNTASGVSATVGGGFGNEASGLLATVGGGDDNTASGSRATVGGGNANTASGAGAFVGGGGYDGTNLSGNQAAGNASTIGGGLGNTIPITGTYAVVGGGISNTVSGPNATVGGGALNTIPVTGAYAVVGGGLNNTASGDGATVGGGFGNKASGLQATVGGGYNNTIPITGTYAVIAGGFGNTASGDRATVGGGGDNTASGERATVGGGGRNTASGAYVTVGGGFSNTVSGGSYATVGGGFRNDASGNSATVGGGNDNTASGSSAIVGGGFNNTASGVAATVPGGVENQANANYSFAAGSRAVAAHTGAFVWADASSAITLTSTADNQFSVRAAGGTRIFSDSGATTGVSLAAGSGSWSSISDRNLKANFLAVDGLDILSLLAGLPIQTWNYTAQDPAIRHLGPTAQDFHAAFGLGENDTTISTVDAQGVAFAAIQGLYQLAQAQDAQITAQAEQIAALEQQNADLEARLTALEQKVGGGAAPLASGMPVSWLVIGALGASAFWLGRRWNARKGGGR